MFDRQPVRKPSQGIAKRASHTQLPLGPVDDPLEKEADHVVDQVLRRPGHSAPLAAPRQGDSPDLSAAPLTSGGRSLDAATRSYFEPRFGFDFSKVRIHANDEAAESARSLGALAYTAGSQIAFAPEQYQTGTAEGRRLLAHELTHVVQQGHATALPETQGVRPAIGRTGPRIQRDVPQGQLQPQKNGPLIGPLAIYATADTVTRDEVTAALTTFLYKVQKEQGGQTLHVDDAVRTAILRMFQGDPMGMISAEGFLKGITPSNPPEFAAGITKFLPAVVPRGRVAHLGTIAAKVTPDTAPKSFGDAAGKVVVDSTVAPLVKKLPIPKDWQDKIIEGATGAVADGMVSILDQAMSGSPLDDKAKAAIHSAVEGAIKQKAGTPMDRQEEGAGSPYAQVQPPSVAPPFPTAPGEHIFSLPSIKWDIPTKPLPKPNLPEPPTASESKSVESIIQGLDDQSLIPAAVKGKPEADEFASAKQLARSFADQLAAANAKKQYSVELDIPMGYRHQPDLMDTFDKIEAIVRQIAAAIPGGAPNVGEIIITPAKAKDDKTFPARRVVRLKSGD
jgi:hypothetical protein